MAAACAAEDLARILEPFEHAGRGEGAEHAKGAGLGLTLVKAFAELHGGWLELDSSLGRRLPGYGDAAGSGACCFLIFITPIRRNSNRPRYLVADAEPCRDDAALAIPGLH